MTGERLTRGELGWLLAQEARGAASALRAEVKELRASLRPPPPSATPVRITGLDGSQEERISTLPGERHLNALDEAIGLLATLQHAGPRSKRRGRIDLAALLYELAPNCKMSIEPGAGTEVIGDEHELRRMFHMLLSQNTGSGDGTTLNTIELRRQDQWIHISVELGPDTAATSDLERRWLSRMTLKHGGRLELHGKRQVVVLPAETSSQEEVDQLKRELQQAQLLGEAYAKELATALSGDSILPAESAPTSSPGVGHWSDPVRALAKALLPSLQAVQRAPSGPALEALDIWVRQLALMTEDDDTSIPFSIGTVVSQTVETLTPDAQRRDVLLRNTTDPSLSALRMNAPANTVSSLLALLVEHAIAATHKTGEVGVGVEQSRAGVCVVVTDQGAAVPESMAQRLLHGSADPRALGRPAGPALMLAAALAERMGANIHLSSETEHTRVVVTFS